MHTRSAVTSAAYPPRIDYTIDVAGIDGSNAADDRYRATCDPPNGEIRVFPLSDEQLAAPAPVPRGINLSLDIAGDAIPIGRPEHNADLFGVPLLDPTYMFGLRYLSSRRTDPGTQDSVLPVIAVVSSGTQDYHVSLIDAPEIDGSPTYHLELAPLRRPRQNRLRELWVGSQDFLPRKAIVSGNFTDRPLVDVPWTIDFTVIDGAPYVSREMAGATLFLEHRRAVRDAVIAFQDLREPGAIYGRPLVTPEESRTASMLVEPQP